MANPSDVEARLAALEARMEEVAADAAAARHLAASRDRDLADLGVKVDANRAVINGLGGQVTGRFDQLENEMHTGFAERVRTCAISTQGPHPGWVVLSARGRR